MKKIVPFRKEISINNIFEVTSISLEHTLTHDGYQVDGEFNISGEYRVTETSQTTEPFNYDLPFSISIDEKYNIDKLTIDIDDFYYEIIDNNILVINIDVLLDKLEERVEAIKEKEEVLVEERGEELEMKEKEVSCVEKEEDIKPLKETRTDIIGEINNDNIKSIFSNVSNEETYISYKVYIVRENDSAEKIMTKYNIEKEKLEEYNDLSLIKVGDKIIIPYVKD